MSVVTRGRWEPARRCHAGGLMPTHGGTVTALGRPLRGLSAARVETGGVKLRGTGAELLRHPRVREAQLSV